MRNVKPIALIIAILLTSVPSLTAVTTTFAQESDEEDGSESEPTEESEQEPEPEPSCPDGQVLEDGECVDRTDITCPDGQVLEDGECVDIEPPPEPPTQCDPPEVPCSGGTGPTEPPEVPTPQPTPTTPTNTAPPNNNSTSTNPDDLIQQPAALQQPPCEVWNIAGQDQNQCKFKIRGTVRVNTQDRGLIPISHLYVEVCGEKPTKVHLMCGRSLLKDYTDLFGRFEIDLPADEYKEITHVVLSSINEDRTLVVTHPAISAIDNPAVVTAKKPKPPFSPSPEVEEINMVFYSSFSIKSANAKSFLQINSKDVNYPDWYTNNVPANELSDLLLVHHYTSQSLIYAKTELKVFIGAGSAVKSLTVQVYSTGGTAYHADPSKPYTTIDLDISDSMFDFPDKQSIIDDFFALFHEFGHFIDHATTSRQWTETSKELHPKVQGVAKNCHQGYAQLDSSCSFKEARATFVGFLVKAKVLIDSQHEPYGRSLEYGYPGWTTKVNDIYHIVGIGPIWKATTKIFVYEWNPLHEEAAYASLLWNLYDRPLSIHPKTIMDHAFMSKTIADFYNRIRDNNNLIPTDTLQGLFAKYGICIDNNNDGKCTIKDDLINGWSAWSAHYPLPKKPDGTVPHNEFDYLYSGRK